MSFKSPDHEDWCNLYGKHIERAGKYFKCKLCFAKKSLRALFFHVKKKHSKDVEQQNESSKKNISHY